MTTAAITEARPQPGGWTRVEFGDVVSNSTTSVDPRSAGLERFVGLDHLDAESLDVRRWGDVADGTTFTRSFRPGDVLFGKRRAYQRKAAVASFSGVCSGDILVFRPSSERLDADFLPLIVQSDSFVAHALGTSAGSLSPRTKWKDLAQYEFLLPPLERQKEIVAVMAAARAHLSALGHMEDAAVTALGSLVDAFFAADNGQRVALSSVAEVRSGLTVNAARRAKEKTLPYLRVANVGPAGLDLAEVKAIGADDADVKRYGLSEGDILVVEGHASGAEVGRSAVWPGAIHPCLHQNHLFCVRAGDAVRSAFLGYALSASASRVYFRSRAKSTSGLHTINSTVVKELPVRVPSLPVQDALVANANALAACAQATSEALDAATILARALRERLLGHAL